jgi:subtilase family serine protease
MRAAVTAPKLEGAAGAMVAAVTGLTETAATQDIMQAVDPDTGQAYPGIAAASMDGKAFASQCFYGAQTQVIATLHATTPTATYSGTRYGASNTNTAAGTLPPCGYDAANLQGAYGLNEVYARGVDGSGQTIVIVDAYQQPTIKDDVNTYSKLNGLPKLGASNFQVVYPEGKPKSQDLSATQETSLDVEMAHMVAPGANIALVLSPSLYLSDLETCVFYAISHDLGSVISNSYGAPEAFVDEQDLLIEDSISELGAALGIAVNYSTGDYGDWAVLYGIPTVSMPADSPYSTAVGGTSLSINANNQMVFQTGWGMNVTKIGAGINGLTTGPLNPVINLGFNGGAGGGESGFFVKPFWQYELPGIGRQQPDISFDADPYTGAEVVYTVDGVQIISTLGGTSLACPSFSAIWALANQRAGQLYGEGALLGQAAPYIADLAGTTAITDVKPYASYDVAGYYYGGHGSIFYSPNQLAAPLENTTEFLSALYNGASGAWYTLTFGTDSSLVVSPGWDNVTGFGTPNGWDFVNAAAKLP